LLLVITTVITSLLAGAINAYVAEVAPLMFTPFFFHWYVGVVPPLVGVAVKFTAVPEQTVVASAAITTEGVTGLPRLIVVALEVKVHPFAETVQVYTPGVSAM